MFGLVGIRAKGRLDNLHSKPNFSGIGIHSSYAILISKETGDVVFDGDACDEVK